MEKDRYKTKVIFRKFREGDIIALFPEDLGDGDPSTCNSYMRVGQHGSADIGRLLMITLPCNPDEYASLYAELEGLGYNLVVRQRYTQKMRDTRLQTYSVFYRHYMETLSESTEIK